MMDRICLVLYYERASGATFTRLIHPARDFSGNRDGRVAACDGATGARADGRFGGHGFCAARYGLRCEKTGREARCYGADPAAADAYGGGLREPGVFVVSAIGRRAHS